MEKKIVGKMILLMNFRIFITKIYFSGNGYVSKIYW